MSQIPKGEGKRMARFDSLFHEIMETCGVQAAYVIVRQEGNEHALYAGGDEAAQFVMQEAMGKQAQS